MDKELKLYVEVGESWQELHPSILYELRKSYIGDVLVDKKDVEYRVVDIDVDRDTVEYYVEYV